MRPLRVNHERLWQSLMTMAKIGGLPGGGCCRLALTDDDKNARDLFRQWCETSGCTVQVDKVGNMYARRAGTNKDLPGVATGSHLDTQPHGGKFDGIYGVLAGLEVVRTLNDADVQTAAPVDVIVWTNEEGARFSPPLTGSSTYAAAISVDEVHRLTTHDGKSVGNELTRINYLGDIEPGHHALSLFVEAHIEQGPILEFENCQIGVVEGVQGIRWLDVDVQGIDSHAGTVPMKMRRDALMGASEMISLLRRIAVKADPEFRLTVGRMDVTPNSGIDDSRSREL